MTDTPKQSAPKVLKMLHVCFANLPQQQTLQPRHTLTIIRAHLRQQPM
jgi:hypothetical protein